MSSSIAQARQSLHKVKGHIKQGKALGAAQAIQSAVNVMRRESLMKAERTELQELIEDGVRALNADPLTSQVFPLALAYTPGNEDILAESLQEMIECFDEYTKAQAEEAKRLQEEKKRETLERGKGELLTNVTKGRATLLGLARSYPQDADMIGKIGEAFLHAKLYEEAVSYLTSALDMKEDILPLYNSIGMALRMLQKYDLAQTYYLRASKYLRNDPNLFFNIGRLYLEWKKLDKAKQAAQAALKLDPDFVPAQKLLNHLEKIQAS